MAITIRTMDRDDRDTWADMRSIIWTDTTRAGHLVEIDEILDDDDAWAFLAQSPEGRPVGFAEVSIRKYANGCTKQPVAYLEGIFVSPDQRRTGVGQTLIRHIEDFFAAKGFTELCSDAPERNTVSRAAHKKWGFHETEVVINFNKSIDAGKKP